MFPIHGAGGSLLRFVFMNAPMMMGMACMAVAIWHEASWWKRRDWQRLAGRVVDIHIRTEKNRTSHHPVISYEAREGERQFTSKYGGNVPPKVGDQVTVIVSPDGSLEEHFTKSNRWFISAIAFSMGALLLIKGFIDLRA